MKKITVNEVKNKLDQKTDFVLLDVLPADKYASAHIPGAVNIPLDAPDFEAQVEKLVGRKDRVIAVQCWSTECTWSEKAYEQLSAVGYSNVHEFVEGTMGWKDAGYELQTGEESPKACAA